MSQVTILCSALSLLHKTFIRLLISRGYKVTIFGQLYSNSARREEINTRAWINNFHSVTEAQSSNTTFVINPDPAILTADSLGPGCWTKARSLLPAQRYAQMSFNSK